jgi:CheY-like chemotaxis protein
MNSSRTRILCIADYTESCRLIDELLFTEKFNLDFTVTQSPRQALSLIAGESFDLFLVKSRLPEMTGVELCRRIRKIDQETPILFLSGGTRSSDCQVALAAGVNRYLMSPFSLAKLAETVKDLVSGSPKYFNPRAAGNRAGSPLL